MCTILLVYGTFWGRWKQGFLKQHLKMVNYWLFWQTTHNFMLWEQYCQQWGVRGAETSQIFSWRGLFVCLLISYCVSYFNLLIKQAQGSHFSSNFAFGKLFTFWNIWCSWTYIIDLFLPNGGLCLYIVNLHFWKQQLIIFS